MVTAADILKFLETIAPSYMAEDWDRIGLNCGHMRQPVTTVLVALDPFRGVCREAKEVGAQLLLTHHPLVWEEGFVNDASEQGRNILFLAENQIAHINAHTNLDCAPGGVNDILAELLGLKDTSVIDPKGTDSQGRQWGLLRSGTVDEQPLTQFLGSIKSALNCSCLKYADGGRPVRKVAVGGGACGSSFAAAAAAGCDTFVTSDVKYNQFWDAQAMGLNLIDAGHFHTENPVCRYLAGELSKAFPQLTVLLSTGHSDCAKYFA